MHRYLAIAFLHLMLVVYIVLSFTYNEAISQSEDMRYIIAWMLGLLLETSNFMYTCLLPLKIAKDITDMKIKSFSR
jgi:hypothetical protein